MNIVEIGTIVASVVTAVGGFEFIKWWSNRRAYARKELADAKSDEQKLYARQIEWYEKRLGERDMKVDSLYKELRDSQARELELTERCNSLELEKQLLIYQKCEVRGCGNRKPPGDY